MTAIAMSEISVSLEANGRPTYNYYQKPSHVRPPYLRFQPRSGEDGVAMVTNGVKIKKENTSLE
jgi:hypothetical protein